MSIDVHNQGTGTEAGGSSASSRPHAIDSAARVPAEYRETFVAQRNGLIAELGKCHDEGIIVGKVIQGLPAIVNLRKTLRFSDAFTSPREQDVTLVPETVRPLQESIFQIVRDNAGRADTFCDTAQEKLAFMSRLNRQFDTMLNELIEKEQSACGAKAAALCDRIDDITGMIRVHYGETLDGKLVDFEACGAALRAYIQRYSTEGGVGTFPLEVRSQQTGAAVTSLLPHEFFDMLSTTTVRLLNHLTPDGAGTLR
jgi:hypothetical protein